MTTKYMDNCEFRENRSRIFFS